jgi:hypothetical protein
MMIRTHLTWFFQDTRANKLIAVFTALAISVGGCWFVGPEPETGIPAGATVAHRSSVSQYGITWTFDKAYPVGQFVNGDYWVVGPVKINSISPKWDGQRNGSMINPRTGNAHGYHAQVYGYTANLNVTASLTKTSPLTVNPDSSIVSTAGWLAGEPGAPPANGSIPGVPRPAVRSAAVLTVMSSVPPSGSFRPPFGYGGKLLYNISQIKWGVLPKLTPVANAPSFATIERTVQRLRIDHVGYSVGTQYIAPSDNYHGYGKEFATEINDAILMMLLNYPDAQKEKTLIEVLQIGIDLHGVLKDSDGKFAGNRWWGDYGGGHGSGRKWPILFTGIVLNDTEMKNIGKTWGSIKFGEDCQTFYSAGALPDNPREAGQATWSDRHCSRGYVGGWASPYRLCCTANAWVGEVLGARLMNAKELWNHDALFDYQDFYMQERHTSKVHDYTSAFADAMWDTYR